MLVEFGEVDRHAHFAGWLGHDDHWVYCDTPVLYGLHDNDLLKELRLVHVGEPVTLLGRHAQRGVESLGLCLEVGLGPLEEGVRGLWHLCVVGLGGEECWDDVGVRLALDVA